jgi:hypothetical protein
VVPAKPLAALLLILCSVPAAAGVIELRATEDPPRAEAAAPGPAAVDAPPILPIFAGALAVLGWRLGRRRRR